MKSWQWVSAIFMAIIFIILGGFREIVFVNINEQIAYDNGLIDTYRVLDSFTFLKQYSISGLIRLKWVLTLAFASLYLGLCWISMRYVLLDSKGSMWILYLFLIGIAVAGTIHLLGRITGANELAYTLSRVIMGALQSPFPLMLMIPARMLASR